MADTTLSKKNIFPFKTSINVKKWYYNRYFKLNRSTEEVFNPRPSNPSLLCHSLIELLSIVSPAFKRNFALVQKRRMQKHPFERVATPYQVYQWASPMLDHTVDAIRAEDSEYILCLVFKY